MQTAVFLWVNLRQWRADHGNGLSSRFYGGSVRSRIDTLCEARDNSKSVVDQVLRQLLGAPYSFFRRLPRPHDCDPSSRDQVPPSLVIENFKWVLGISKARRIIASAVDT